MKPRKRDIVWMLICLALAAAYIERGNYADENYLLEAKAKAERKKAALFATLVTHCLNGGALSVADHVIDCKPRRK